MGRLDEIIGIQVRKAILEHTTTQRDRDEYRSRMMIESAVDSGEIDAYDVMEYLFGVIKANGLSFVDAAEALVGEAETEGYEEYE